MTPTPEEAASTHPPPQRSNTADKRPSGTCWLCVLCRMMCSSCSSLQFTWRLLTDNMDIVKSAVSVSPHRWEMTTYSRKHLMSMFLHLSVFQIQEVCLQRQQGRAAPRQKSGSCFKAFSVCGVEISALIQLLTQWRLKSGHSSQPHLHLSRVDLEADRNQKRNDMNFDFVC